MHYTLGYNIPQNKSSIELNRRYLAINDLGRILELYQSKHLELNDTTMLRWTILFLVIALIAAIFGFGGIAAGAASIAKIIFFVFLVLLVISLIMGAVKKT